MRILWPFLLLVPVAVGSARASSFIVLEAVETPIGPSMIILESRETQDNSPSIIAYGVPAGVLSKIAKAGQQPEPPRGRQALVIRGGISGAPYLRAQAGASATPPGAPGGKGGGSRPEPASPTSTTPAAGFGRPE